MAPEFLHRLELLELRSKRILAGRLKGERRSARRGTSVEFADHKPYVMGDDLRFIDWNIFARLDRLFIKLFEEEEDLHLHVLLDVSKSMTFGEPTKLDQGKRLAAALAFVGLVNNDRVVLSPFADRLLPGLPPMRGRRSLWRVLGFLERLAAEERGAGSNLGATCRSVSLGARAKGIVVIISDMFDKEGYETGLRYLAARGMEVYVIHVLAREEVDPPLAGDLKLIDIEDEEVTEVTISAPLLKRYRAHLERFLAELRQFCLRRGMGYLFTTSDAPFERLVLNYLRDQGLLR